MQFKGALEVELKLKCYLGMVTIQELYTENTIIILFYISDIVSYARYMASYLNTWIFSKNINMSDDYTNLTAYFHVIARLPYTYTATALYTD